MHEHTRAYPLGSDLPAARARLGSERHPRGATRTAKRLDLAVRYLVRRDATRAEVRLMIAVLEEAISCFRKHLLDRDKKRQRLFCEAEAWIMTDESSRPFSFDHVCDVVGLDAFYLRRLLRQWRDQQLATMAAPQQDPMTAEIRVERRERRTFTNEFKAETVQRVLERGRRIRAVAREIDLNPSLVSKWVREAEIGAGVSPAECEELQRLRRANQLRIQRE